MAIVRVCVRGNTEICRFEDGTKVVDVQRVLGKRFGIRGGSLERNGFQIVAASVDNLSYEFTGFRNVADGTSLILSLIYFILDCQFLQLLGKLKMNSHF